MDLLKLFKKESAFCLKDLLHVDNFQVQVMQKLISNLILCMLVDSRPQGFPNQNATFHILKKNIIKKPI